MIAARIRAKPCFFPRPLLTATPKRLGGRKSSHAIGEMVGSRVPAAAWRGFWKWPGGDADGGCWGWAVTKRLGSINRGERWSGHAGTASRVLARPMRLTLAA